MRLPVSVSTALVFLLLLFPPCRGEEAIREPADSVATFEAVMATKAKLALFERIAISDASMVNSGYILPDYGAPDDEELRRMHYPLVGDSDFYRWNGGRSLFRKLRKPMFSFAMSEEEFSLFIKDSFNPDGGGYDYNLYQGHCPIFTSYGPDRKKDLLLEDYNLERSPFGLGDITNGDITNKVYDPTNGVFSSGDIVFPDRLLTTLLTARRQLAISRTSPGPDSDSRVEVLEKVWLVEHKFEILEGMTLNQPSIYNSGWVLPDYCRDQDPGCRELHHYIVRDGEFIAWEGGRGLEEDYLWDHVTTSIKLNEKNRLITDPFDPQGGNFDYNLYHGAVAVFTSFGPDGDKDLDISQLGLKDVLEGRIVDDHFGLPPDFMERIYDPTNGAVSNGDIVHPPGIDARLSLRRKALLESSTTADPEKRQEESGNPEGRDSP